VTSIIQHIHEFELLSFVALGLDARFSTADVYLLGQKYPMDDGTKDRAPAALSSLRKDFASK